MKVNSFSAWVLAVRPYSLGASAIPVAVGSALAWSDGGFKPAVCMLCLLFAMLTQCTANLVNDLCDFLRGADRPDRLGPDRAFAKGYITLPAMKAGIACFTLAAAAAGGGLLFFGGWKLLFVGLACLFFAYVYTAGPWPLAYHGLGDVAVIVFFGVIPTGFTYLIQTGAWTPQVTAAALACGLVIDTMLWINNFRDRKEDARCGKRTVVVLFGERFGRWGYPALGAAALALCLSLGFDGRPWAALLPLLYAVPFFRTWRKMIRIDHGDALNVCLGETARNMQLFGILLTLGILLG